MEISTLTKGQDFDKRTINKIWLETLFVLFIIDENIDIYLGFQNYLICW